MTYLLLLLVLLPAAGAAVVAVLPRAESAKYLAAVLAAVTGLFALVATLRSPYTMPAAAAHSWASLPALRVTFHLGIDGISGALLLMSAVLVPLAIWSAFDAVTEKPRQFYAWMLALLAAINGVFLARDLVLFYAFFELTLVPSFFLIGLWGGPDRREAATKFFLYTFVGGVFTLAAIVYAGAKAGTFDLERVVAYAQHAMTLREQFWVATGLLAAFAVKSALFPFHTWLPLAYVEAPTPVTVVLAGVLPKLGTYGILRLCIPIGLASNDTGGPRPFQTLGMVVGALCVAGVLYGALIAWVQRDAKRLLAYSSFSHLGLVVMGLMALTAIGVQGSVLYMVNHGLSTGALFLCVGIVADRYRSRDLDQISGLAKVMPKFAFFLVLFAMSSIGLPGLNGFVSEWLTLQGTFGGSPSAGDLPAVSDVSQLGPRFAVLAAIGMILAAIYMLTMVGHLLFGPTVTPAGDVPAKRRASLDLTGRELAILTPLAVLVVVLGFAPMTLLKWTAGPVNQLLSPVPAGQYSNDDFARANPIPQHGTMALAASK